jgi:hypothetical protein
MQPAPQDDPFEIVEAEVARGLADVQARLRHWRQISGGSQAEVAQAARLKTAMLGALTELGVDLDDMAATVTIAAKSAARFALSEAELERRRQFIATSREEVESMRRELEAADAPTPRQAKQRGERAGLLSSSSTCRVAPSDAASSSTRTAERQRDSTA